MTPDVLSIRKLMTRRNLSRAESAELLGRLLREDVEGWRLLAWAVAEVTKGETVDELLGMFDALRGLTGEYDVGLPQGVMDLSSAGGSGIHKINVSTLAALVVGEPELPVCKTSFWGITSLTGSADVLRAAGIDVTRVGVREIGQALRSPGVAFYHYIFASPELGNVANFGGVLARKVAVNTPFNLLAPLYTPFSPSYRMFGHNDGTQLELVVEACRGAGYRGVLAVHGMDGLDEASLCAPTRVRGYRGGEELDFLLEPEQVGLSTVAPEALRPEDARSNVRDFLRIARGLERGPKRDLVALNSALSLYLAGRAASIEEGVQLAVSRLERGDAWRKLGELVAQHGSPEALQQAASEHLSP